MIPITLEVKLKLNKRITPLGSPNLDDFSICFMPVSGDAVDGILEGY